MLVVSTLALEVLFGKHSFFLVLLFFFFFSPLRITFCFQATLYLYVMCYISPALTFASP